MEFLYKNGENAFDIREFDNGELLIQVKVKDFSGQFTYLIEDENLKAYQSSLEELILKEQGCFKFADMDSDSFIYFEKSKNGYVKISGQLGMKFRNNYLIFEMDADQTVIEGLISRLKQIV